MRHKSPQIHWDLDVSPGCELAYQCQEIVSQANTYWVVAIMLKGFIDNRIMEGPEYFTRIITCADKKELTNLITRDLWHNSNLEALLGALTDQYIYGEPPDWHLFYDDESEMAKKFAFKGDQDLGSPNLGTRSSLFLWKVREYLARRLGSILLLPFQSSQGTKGVGLCLLGCGHFWELGGAWSSMAG